MVELKMSSRVVFSLGEMGWLCARLGRCGGGVKTGV